MTFAVIPAAGHSVRMGRPKLRLPLGDRTVLEWVVSAFRKAGVEHVLVVLGPHVGELEPLAAQAGAEVCLLESTTPDMRTTVERGLNWLDQRFQPGSRDFWFLAPADHPTLEAEVVRQLLQAQREQPEYSIVVPTWEGKRGHPAYLAWSHVAGLRDHPRTEGLNTYLRRNADQTLELAVSNASILCDLDTPEDYERICGILVSGGREPPDSWKPQGAHAPRAPRP
jgi:molybdenum cofactor cytidylyltransferase